MPVRRDQAPRKEAPSAVITGVSAPSAQSRRAGRAGRVVDRRRPRRRGWRPGGRRFQKIRVRACYKRSPYKAVKDVEPSRTRPPTSLPPGARATVQLLRACGHAQAPHRPWPKVQRLGGYRSRLGAVVLLAVIFILAPSATWLLAMFATCVTLAQAGWLPPSFLRGPWAPPARCPCHEHGDRGEQLAVARRRSRQPDNRVGRSTDISRESH